MQSAIRFFALVALTFAPLAAAQHHHKALRKAVRALDEAASMARRGSPQCQVAVLDTLERLVEQVEQLRGQNRPRVVALIKFEVSNAGSAAAWSGCPPGVVAAIHRASDYLDEVRLAMPHQHHDDDEDDERWQRAEMSPLQVRLDSSIEAEPAVRVHVPQLTLRNMRGERFYFGARFRSFGGDWSPWVTTQQWVAPADPFVWRRAFNHYFRYSTLAEEDFAQGRFVARISVFDSEGRELAFREVTFSARVPQLPPGPPPEPMEIHPAVVRDCGTGPDVGCAMMRDGRFPMDAIAFQGFMRSLEGTSSEMMRGQTAQTLFNHNYVTAVQFGLLLDLFHSEMFKLQVAQFGAPRVVNPQHAIGYADKFNSNMHRAAYTQLMAEQPQSGVPPPHPYGYRQPAPPPPPPPGRPPPPPPPSGQAPPPPPPSVHQPPPPPPPAPR